MKPTDNNSQTVWERIVNEPVESTLKRIGGSIVNEMALPLKTFRQRVDGLRFQLIENWCLLKYCQMYSPNNVNLAHWSSEFIACADYIRGFEIKGGMNKQRTITKMLVVDYDYNQSRKILPIIRDKFDLEKIHDNAQREAVAQGFSNSINSLITFLCDTSISNAEYMKTTFNMDEEMTKNIYQLIAVSLDTRAWGDRRIHKQKDGSILTHEQHLGIFTTVENAELMIQEYLAHLSESDVLLGFFLYERPLDESYETSEEVCLGGHKSVRSYLADGTLNCFSDLDTECVKLFTGRDPGTLKVKKGDYAYAYQRDRVVPMLVGALPPNRKWFERRKRRDPGFAGGDYSDDSYWGLEIDGHFHPFAADVFPAFCPINKVIKKKLDYSYRVETVPGEYEKWCKRNRHKWQKRKAGRF